MSDDHDSAIKYEKPAWMAQFEELRRQQRELEARQIERVMGSPPSLWSLPPAQAWLQRDVIGLNVNPMTKDVGLVYSPSPGSSFGKGFVVGAAFVLGALVAAGHLGKTK